MRKLHDFFFITTQNVYLENDRNDERYSLFKAGYFLYYRARRALTLFNRKMPYRYSQLHTDRAMDSFCMYTKRLLDRLRLKWGGRAALR